MALSMGYIDKLAKRHKEFYSKDAIVSHLTKVEAELRIDKGFMQFTIDELRHQNKDLKRQVKKLTEEPFRDKTYKEIKNKLKVFKYENHTLKKENDLLYQEILILKTK